jgi:uncharacterized protein (TIGR04255 family)
MSQQSYHLKDPPIVEMILDMDCELAPGFDLGVREAEIRDEVSSRYPKMRQQLLQEHQISQPETGPPEVAVRRNLQALQFFSADDKQAVQFRANGFSFNRLAPYSKLDDYLPEIEWAWGIFLATAKPVTLRKISLRTINRLLLPLSNGMVTLEDYLRTCPRLPDESRLTFTGFLNHHSAAEPETKNHVNILLTTQAAEHNALPLILDIDAYRPVVVEPPPWSVIVEVLHSLRDLKNRVFWNTLTDKCRNLFSPSA